MALIPSQALGPDGTAPAFDDAAIGDTANLGDRFYLEVRNSNAASRTVTIAGHGVIPESGDDYPDREYTVAADTGEVRIPLGATHYRNPTTNVADVSYSDVAGLVVAVVQY